MYFSKDLGFISDIGADDCGEEIDLDKLKKIEITALEAFADFCESNGLHFFLCGGTLLGALRHKGFIPWDDDIDISMPREDFEKLFEIAGGKVGKYKLVRGGEDPYAPIDMWGRLYNMDFVVANCFGGATKEPFYYHPVFIDIFPVDGFPAGQFKTQMYVFKLKFLSGMANYSWHRHCVGQTLKVYLRHLLLFLPAKIVGYKRWSRLFLKEVSRYPVQQSDYVGVTAITKYQPREKLPKEGFFDYVSVSFEGRQYPAPGLYDRYLSNLYGDYMKLPPVEAQNSQHYYTVYKRK